MPTNQKKIKAWAVFDNKGKYVLGAPFKPDEELFIGNKGRITTKTTGAQIVPVEITYSLPSTKSKKK